MDTISIGNTRQVFWDDYLIDTDKTTAFSRIINPERKECCFIFDHPSETYSISYPCIVKLENSYRMYYQPWTNNGSTCVCVIESKDGITWRKPHLNIYDIPDMEENNVVIDKVRDGIFIFRDPNPVCPDEEKFKAVGISHFVYPDGEKRSALCCFTSPDGYHFTLAYPMTRYGTFDSLNTVMWDGEKYICYLRSLHNIDGLDDEKAYNFSEVYGHIKDWKKIIRDVRVMYSKDFHEWTVPEIIKFDDGKDYPLYTNNIEYYERAPIYIGFPVRYCERPNWTKNVEQMASYEIKKKATEKVEDRTGRVATDCVFMCSHDGKKWHRFNEAFLTPGYEETHNWIYGDCYLSYHMLDSGKEYYNLYTIDRHFSFGYPRPLNRYEIRKDGFACYMAGGDEKILTTKPITFDGSVLHLNFETSAYGFIYVSITDEDGNDLSGESVEIYGNNIDRKVPFGDSYDVSAFSGKKVVLKFRMRDAKLYSMKFE